MPTRPLWFVDFISTDGLPPTPADTDAFLNDQSTDAYEKLVDRLLASPRFGERWGRHWLDVARFGESLTLCGFVFEEAWRDRDDVIDAFNRDMPFDRFMQEQVAGDLLPAPTPALRRQQLIATTFLTMGNSNLEEQDKQQLRMDVVDEQLSHGWAFLAQTIGCARCDHHKFDPIPTKDYYALAGNPQYQNPGACQRLQMARDAVAGRTRARTGVEEARNCGCRVADEN